MKKMPCLYKRIFVNHKAFVAPFVTDGCEWVFDGDGVPSIKIDGTSCMIKGGELYARYDCKPSKSARRKHKKGEPWQANEFKTPPQNSIPCQAPDLITGHWPHWVLIEDQPEYKYHREAFELFKNSWDKYDDIEEASGTYELIGPAIGGNPEKQNYHNLVKHGDIIVTDLERSFWDIRNWLLNHEVEGVVFAHPDGRMCKIRRKDFGFDWPVNNKNTMQTSPNLVLSGEVVASTKYTKKAAMAIANAIALSNDHQKDAIQKWANNYENGGYLHGDLLACSFWHCDAPYLLNHLAESGQDEMLKLVTEQILLRPNDHKSSFISSITRDIKKLILKK